MRAGCHDSNVVGLRFRHAVELIRHLGQEFRDAHGWFIDQYFGWAYGYYGLLNDGVNFDPVFNAPGSNGTPNTLYDQPDNWPNNTLFFAVDVATCFKPSSKYSSCKNRILGYYVWSYGVDANGNASAFVNTPGWEGLEYEFQSAVAAWNAWAPTSGQQTMSTSSYPVQTYPNEPTLPNAVPFPAFSDL